ncbi:alcohol dehydrogenase catalytic domain-containing protein [Candidatus Binatia bacterium]|jgi:D-arabinose 1-dehydrogenase-like Zn-dependent alcohol dehydrogenase|nr:alcohol dehydrogenase catalytic domain-containing protein [Candidatus Binatia bacterium]
MAKMRAVQVSRAGGPLEVVERDVPDPGRGEVRIRVQACGICHSDVLTKEGGFPGQIYPRIPGHEVVGVVDAVGAGVARLAVGERVGVGWNGGWCGHCDPCRRGNFFACRTATRITGITSDGGYAELMVAPQEAVARVPDALAAADAAPLLCAGLTTFNALRNSGARGGDVVAVLGLGGLGHLGVQYAARMGFRTVAIARGKDKEPLAQQLGAWRYVDSTAEDPAAALAALGGASVVLATVTNGEAMSATIGGLAPHGTLLVLGAPPSLEAGAFALIAGQRSIRGWYSGTSIDAEDTLGFSVQSGVRSMNEAYPLERAAEAYERMLSGRARFRVVLTMDS